MVDEFPFPTLIAEATCVEGNITFFTTAHVFGVVEGDLIQQVLEPIQIGKGGWIHGSIFSQGVVLVEGRVDGDIRSMTKIKLLPTATVKGCLMAPVIDIRAGAILNGSLSMRQEPAKLALRTAI